MMTMAMLHLIGPESSEGTRGLHCARWVLFGKTNSRLFIVPATVVIVILPYVHIWMRRPLIVVDMRYTSGEPHIVSLCPDETLQGHVAQTGVVAAAGASLPAGAVDPAPRGTIAGPGSLGKTGNDSHFKFRCVHQWRSDTACVHYVPLSANESCAVTAQVCDRVRECFFWLQGVHALGGNCWWHSALAHRHIVILGSSIMRQVFVSIVESARGNWWPIDHGSWEHSSWLLYRDGRDAVRFFSSPEERRVSGVHFQAELLLSEVHFIWAPMHADREIYKELTMGGPPVVLVVAQDMWQVMCFTEEAEHGHMWRQQVNPELREYMEAVQIALASPHVSELALVTTPCQHIPDPAKRQLARARDDYSLQVLMRSQSEKWMLLGHDLIGASFEAADMTLKPIERNWHHMCTVKVNVDKSKGCNTHEYWQHAAAAVHDCWPRLVKLENHSVGCDDKIDRAMGALLLERLAQGPAVARWQDRTESAYYKLCPRSVTLLFAPVVERGPIMTLLSAAGCEAATASFSEGVTYMSSVGATLLLEPKLQVAAYYQLLVARLRAAAGAPTATPNDEDVCVETPGGETAEISDAAAQVCVATPTGRRSLLSFAGFVSHWTSLNLLTSWLNSDSSPRHRGVAHLSMPTPTPEQSESALRRLRSFDVVGVMRHLPAFVSAVMLRSGCCTMCDHSIAGVSAAFAAQLHPAAALLDSADLSTRQQLSRRTLADHELYLYAMHARALG